MPEIYVAALFVDARSRILLAKRKDDDDPFAGSWTLPSGEMGAEETAEEALARIGRTELRVTITAFEFAETLYLDRADGQRIESIFIVAGWDGKLGFRTSGDYDDARWFTLEEVPNLPLIPEQKSWLAANFLGAKEQTSQSPDAVQASAESGQSNGSELTVRTEVPQYGPGCPNEDQLQLLGDVSGKSILEMCCLGGQNAIAFAKRGASATGIDSSEEQIRFARELASREGVNVEFIAGNVEAMPQVGDETQDIVFSEYGLAYIEKIDLSLAEANRVLKPGGMLVFSSHHPFSQIVTRDKPWIVQQSYWSSPDLADWDVPERRLMVRATGYYRSLGTWFRQIREAGFEVEAVLEPQPVDSAQDGIWDKQYSLDRMRTIPSTIIFKARKS